jgi:lathosterol oxidase
MNVFSSFKTLTDTLQEAALLSVRFFLFAGAIFLFFYVWKKRKYWYLKIQQKFPDKKHVLREIRYSFYTVFIFGIIVLQVEWASNHHYTLLYRPIDKYGYVYYVFSILLMIFVHDTYFYWTHRLLHWKPLFKTVHVVHHFSNNPTPFSAYAFHPVEALIEIGIVPLIVSRHCALLLYRLHTADECFRAHGLRVFPKRICQS